MSTPAPDQHETGWLFVAILFAVLFSYPLLQVFNRTTQVFGIPLLILYLLLGWLFFIWNIYRFCRRLDKGGGADAPSRNDDRP